MLFTVIICSQAFKDKCEGRYSGFLYPLLVNNENFEFCVWNTSKDTFEEALPDLKKITEHKNKWRAVVVLDDENYGRENVSKRNPFNFVDAVDHLDEFETAEQIENFREQRRHFYRSAIDNPLMKLGIWLDGSPLNGSPEPPDTLSLLPDVSSEDYFKALYKMHLTAYEVEYDRIVEERKKFIEDNFSPDGELSRKPSQIVVVSERVFINDDEAAKAAWNKKNEFAYSRFYEDNLYPSKFRYILFNIPYVKGARVEIEYLNFLVFVLVMAQNEYPADSVKSERVYSVNMTMDTDKINNFYSHYVGKLNATLDMIKARARKTLRRVNDPLTDTQAQELFESDIEIPVVINKDYSTDELYAKYDGLGLATDCPESEDAKWKTESHNIIKRFVRYIREPRKAIKTAAENDFHMNSEIDDVRIARLTENQLEDIRFRILEEEERMIATRTPRLFRTEEFSRKIEKEDKAIKRTISHRMTRAKTLIIGLIAVAAYLFGFLPLIIDSHNDTKSFSFAVIITACGLGLFLLGGLIYLLVMWFRLRERFKYFNKAMAEILGEINDGLNSFSKYLSHACNVMRGFSVLNYSQKVFITKQNILKKHAWDIERKIDDVTELFSGYMDFDGYASWYEEPFDYDFSVLCDYDYEMPYEQIRNEISFIQPGYKIEVPINYIATIRLEREELYD